jgi:hypothetical protein
MKPGTLTRAVEVAKKSAAAKAQAEGRVKLTQLGNLLGELLEFHPPVTAGTLCRVCGKDARRCPATRMLALLVDLNWKPEKGA